MPKWIDDVMNWIKKYSRYYKGFEVRLEPAKSDYEHWYVYLTTSSLDHMEIKDLLRICEENKLEIRIWSESPYDSHSELKISLRDGLSLGERKKIENKEGEADASSH